MEEINKSRHKLLCPLCQKQRAIHYMQDGLMICYDCLDKHINEWRE